MLRVRVRVRVRGAARSATRPSAPDAGAGLRGVESIVGAAGDPQQREPLDSGELVQRAGADQRLPVLDPVWRLAVLLAVGGTVYAGWMLAFARAALGELVAVLRKRPVAA